MGWRGMFNALLEHLIPPQDLRPMSHPGKLARIYQYAAADHEAEELDEALWASSPRRAGSCSWLRPLYSRCPCSSLWKILGRAGFVDFVGVTRVPLSEVDGFRPCFAVLRALLSGAFTHSPKPKSPTPAQCGRLS